MRLFATIITVLFICSHSSVAQTIYTQQDSIRIEEILRTGTSGEQKADICHIARMFVGVPYTASTLDSTNCERLIINTRQMDCTTFVETTVALVLTARTKGDFTDFCNNLQRVRYRNAQCSYTERLHYISQWIDDNEQKGIAQEIATAAHTATQKLNLNFMSTHPQSYQQLKENPSAAAAIAAYEEPYRNIEVKYIPKHLLNGTREQLGIENGDILAIVTAIEGLDVTHVGFAEWIEGTLHLIHASSGKREVIADPLSLYQYMKNKKNNLGIRVIRLL